MVFVRLNLDEEAKAENRTTKHHELIKKSFHKNSKWRFFVDFSKAIRIFFY